MHNKQEDDGFENGLACIPKNEGDEDKLRADKEEKLGGGDFQYEEPDDGYNDASNNINHLMKLVYCCLCVIQCQCKCSSFPKCIHL